MILLERNSLKAIRASEHCYDILVPTLRKFRKFSSICIVEYVYILSIESCRIQTVWCLSLNNKEKQFFAIRWRTAYALKFKFQKFTVYLTVWVRPNSMLQKIFCIKALSHLNSQLVKKAIPIKSTKCWHYPNYFSFLALLLWYLL